MSRTARKSELVTQRDEPLELACRGMTRDLLNNALH
jgi:hypothetical protein